MKRREGNYTEPYIIEGDKTAARLAPGVQLVIDETCNVVLATPLERIDISNVEGWRESLDQARVFAKIWADDAEQRRLAAIPGHLAETFCANCGCLDTPGIHPEADCPRYTEGWRQIGSEMTIDGTVLRTRCGHSFATCHTDRCFRPDQPLRPTAEEATHE